MIRSWSDTPLKPADFTSRRNRTFCISFQRAAQVAVFTALCIGSLQAADNAVLAWNSATLDSIRATAMAPPMASRAMAITHTAIYDAWAAYDKVAVGTRLGGALRRPESEHTPANKQKAVSYAAYRVLVDLFPTQKARFDDLLTHYGYSTTATTTDPSDPAGIGNSVAAALLEFRHKDGSNQKGDLNPGAYSDYTGYQPVNSVDAIRDPARWQPLMTAAGTPQAFLVPHWGHVTGFALTSGSQFRPGEPPSHGYKLYDIRCEAVRLLSARLTDEDKMIAEYWEDGRGTDTPPGHWNRIAQVVSARDDHSLDQDVKMFFALTNAQFDSGVAVWEAKRHYDYVRPVSAIRLMNRGKWVRAWAGPGLGVQMIRGEEWKPYLETPPFAEYVSGHSTFSSSSAEVLRLFTGSDRYNAQVTFEPGVSRIEPKVTPKESVTLFWETFSEAADQAGLSRRLGGIHFEEGDLRGRTMGRQIGRQVLEKARAYWEGTLSR